MRLYAAAEGDRRTAHVLTAITMGVRHGELAWKRKLNSLIRRNQAEIDAILTDYGCR